MKQVGWGHLSVCLSECVCIFTQYIAGWLFGRCSHTIRLCALQLDVLCHFAFSSGCCPQPTDSANTLPLPQSQSLEPFLLLGHTKFAPSLHCSDVNVPFFPLIQLSGHKNTSVWSVSFSHVSASWWFNIQSPPTGLGLEKKAIPSPRLQSPPPAAHCWHQLQAPQDWLPLATRSSLALWASSAYSC